MKALIFIRIFDGSMRNTEVHKEYPKVYRKNLDIRQINPEVHNLEEVQHLFGVAGQI